MSIILDDRTPRPLDIHEHAHEVKKEIERWIEMNAGAISDLGPVSSTTCIVRARRFAGFECFDCDFTAGDGSHHLITVSACYANNFEDRDAQVVDSVSAITLIGMLLKRLGIRPTVSAS